MALSYSAISTYQNCPLQYRFQYVEKRPFLPSPALSFGKSLHEALRWFYDVPTPDPYPLEELLGHLEDCWVGEGFSSPEEEAKYYYHARSILGLFYRNNVPEFRMPAALEYRFRIDIGICQLSGVIDRLDKSEDGGFEIIDYKTNRRLPPARRLQEDLQLPIYQIAAEKIWEVTPERVTFYYLLQNHRHSFSITRERIEQALAEIERVSHGIDEEAFAPSKNPLCPWCDYIDACPAWEGIRKPAKKSGSAGPPGLEAGEAVDELLLMEKRVSQMLSRMEALKGTVSSYLDDHGISRVGGSTGVAFLDDDGNLTWQEQNPE